MIYKSIKYLPEKRKIIEDLAKLMSKERGTKVSLTDASIEAAKKLLEEKKAKRS